MSLGRVVNIGERVQREGTKPAKITQSNKASAAWEGA